MVLETKYASRSIGDIFYTLRKDETLNGAVGCDNAKKDYYLDDFASDDPLSSISYLLLNGLIPSYSFAEYDLQVKNNGCCGRFGLDESSGKFRVPYLNKVHIQAGQEATLAQYLAAGLPNITGTYAAHDLTDDITNAAATGAFYSYVSSYRDSANGKNKGKGIGFDASRSNAVYGRSNTVQPPSIVLRPMVQLITVAGGLGSGREDSDEDAPEKPTDRLKVPYIFVPGTEAKALEVNANFDYVIRAIEEALGVGESYVDTMSKQTITGEKTFKENVKVPAVEVTPKVGSSHGGYIDFHYSGSEVDYTARLIEDVRGYLSLNQSPPVSDSTTKIATTAWVKSLVSKLGTLSYTMVSAQNGYLALFSDAAKTNRVFLMQWGYVSGASTVTFPTSFVQVYCAQCCTNRTGYGKYGFNHCGNVTTSTMYVLPDGAGWWLAIGR